MFALRHSRDISAIPDTMLSARLAYQTDHRTGRGHKYFVRRALWALGARPQLEIINPSGDADVRNRADGADDLEAHEASQKAPAGEPLVSATSAASFRARRDGCRFVQLIIAAGCDTQQSRHMVAIGKTA